MVGSPASPPSSTDTMSFSSPQEEQNVPLPLPLLQNVLKKESESEEMAPCVANMTVPKQEKGSNQLGLKDTSKGSCGTSSLQMPFGKDNLPDLQLPMLTDWTQDTFWAQLNSPWLQNFTPSNILNFYWLHTKIYQLQLQLQLNYLSYLFILELMYMQLVNQLINILFYISSINSPPSFTLSFNVQLNFFHPFGYTCFHNEPFYSVPAQEHFTLSLWIPLFLMFFFTI